MYKKKIGCNLQRYRKHKDLTQAEVAKKMGCSKQAISSWEKDRTQPGEDELATLANIYGVTPDDLLITEGDRFASYIADASDNEIADIEEFLKGKEISAVAVRYCYASEPIKEAVCKLLDIDRSKFTLEGVEI